MPIGVSISFSYREVVAICDHLQNLKFSSALPNAFTEYGAIMAANVLNSDQAVEMSVLIVRTFVRLREAALQFSELNDCLKEIENRLSKHDYHIAGIVGRLRELTTPTKTKKVRKIGFHVPEEEKQDD